MPGDDGRRDEAMRVEEAWIPMPDGVRLSATLYLPAKGEGPWPPVLEYLPYRKDDAMLARDWDLYSYMTEHGYAGARVDIRGTGRSEGRLPEGEYSEVEQADGEEVIAWLASQSWSTGRVGMWGISWGGFNSIQLAMRNPAALRAIVALCASDDLFHDDVHYIDGMFHVDEYELMIDLLNAMSPAPDFPVDEATLAARFDREPWLLEVIRQQRDGPFWRRGSLGPDYSRLEVPALLVGGWFDGYRDSIPRMLEAVPAPVQAIVGPWNHTFPHRATPGPEIEWRAEAVRWFDRWLRGRMTEPVDDPPIAVYMREWHPPDPGIEIIPGRWRAERTWPPEGMTDRTLFPSEEGSLAATPGGGEHTLPYEPGIGAEAGGWWGEVTPDQAPLDEVCLTYDSPPLEEDVEILGFPIATLRVSADAPLANWFVRLCDVAPAGRSTLVTGGGRSGAQRTSSERPRPIDPGVPFDLEVPLHFTSWVFPKGHRVRMSISNALFPLAWPTPSPMVTTLHLGGSHLTLPIPPAETLPRPRFAAATPRVHAPGVEEGAQIEPTGWTVERDDAPTTTRWEGVSETALPWGRQRFEERLAFRVDDADPAGASVDGEAVTTVTLPGRELIWRGLLAIHGDPSGFRYRYRRALDENGIRIRERTWEDSVSRDHH